MLTLKIGVCVIAALATCMASRSFHDYNCEDGACDLDTSDSAIHEDKGANLLSRVMHIGLTDEDGELEFWPARKNRSRPAKNGSGKPDWSAKIASWKERRAAKNRSRPERPAWTYNLTSPAGKPDWSAKIAAWKLRRAAKNLSRPERPAWTYNLTSPAKNLTKPERPAWTYNLTAKSGTKPEKPAGTDKKPGDSAVDTDKGESLLDEDVELEFWPARKNRSRPAKNGSGKPDWSAKIAAWKERRAAKNRSRPERPAWTYNLTSPAKNLTKPERPAWTYNLTRPAKNGTKPERPAWTYKK